MDGGDEVQSQPIVDEEAENYQGPGSMQVNQ